MTLSCCPLYFQVYLQHLQALLSLSTFTALWLTILDFMDKYMHADQSDQLVSIVLICLPCCHNVQFLTNLCDITGLPIFSNCLSPSSIVINFKPSPWSVLCMFCKLAHFRVCINSSKYITKYTQTIFVPLFRWKAFQSC